MTNERRTMNDGCLRPFRDLPTVPIAAPYTHLKTDLARFSPRRSWRQADKGNSNNIARITAERPDEGRGSGKENYVRSQINTNFSLGPGLHRLRRRPRAHGAGSGCAGRGPDPGASRRACARRKPAGEKRVHRGREIFRLARGPAHETAAGV